MADSTKITNEDGTGVEIATTIDRDAELAIATSATERQTITLGAVIDEQPAAGIDERIAPWARQNNPTGQIPDARIPAAIMRDAELTAAAVRTLLGLTATETNDLLTGATISGQVITFTQNDGTTATITVPAGTGGMADGVVASGAFNVDGTTLTLTLSTGGTVDVSVPALLRGTGGGGLTEAEVDARIAGFARANNPTGQIADARIPASIMRDAELTAAAVRNLLGLTATEVNDLLTGATISGQVITFTQNDGTTAAVTVPAGSGGMADGVVASGAFNADGTTLTLTLDTGGTVDVSVPALLRAAGGTPSWDAITGKDAARPSREQIAAGTDTEPRPWSAADVEAAVVIHDKDEIGPFEYRINDDATEIDSQAVQILGGIYRVGDHPIVITEAIVPVNPDTVASPGNEAYNMALWRMVRVSAASYTTAPGSHNDDAFFRTAEGTNVADISFATPANTRTDLHGYIREQDRFVLNPGEYFMVAVHHTEGEDARTIVASGSDESQDKAGDITYVAKASSNAAFANAGGQQFYHSSSFAEDMRIVYERLPEGLTKEQVTDPDSEDFGKVSGQRLSEAVEHFAPHQDATAIPKVEKLPTTLGSELLYLTHDYTEGTRDNATLTVGISGDFVGYHNGQAQSFLGHGAFGSIDKASPLVALYGLGDASDYTLVRVIANNEAWLAAMDTIALGTQFYALGDLETIGGFPSRPITAILTGASSATFTVNFQREADDSFYWTDGANVTHKAGLYEWNDTQYARISSEGGGDSAPAVLFDGPDTPATYVPNVAARPNFRALVLSRAPEENRALDIVIEINTPNNTTANPTPTGATTILPSESIETNRLVGDDALPALAGAQLTTFSASGNQGPSTGNVVGCKVTRGNENDANDFGHSNLWIGHGLNADGDFVLYVAHSHWSSIPAHKIRVNERLFGGGAAASAAETTSGGRTLLKRQIIGSGVTITRIPRSFDVRSGASNHAYTDVDFEDVPLAALFGFSATIRISGRAGIPIWVDEEQILYTGEHAAALENSWAYAGTGWTDTSLIPCIMLTAARGSESIEKTSLRPQRQQIGWTLTSSDPDLSAILMIPVYNAANTALHAMRLYAISDEVPVGANSSPVEIEQMHAHYWQEDA